jgi:hypothetical protein
VAANDSQLRDGDGVTAGVVVVVVGKTESISSKVFHRASSSPVKQYFPGDKSIKQACKLQVCVLKSNTIKKWKFNKKNFHS